jgi:hypothetical protein
MSNTNLTKSGMNLDAPEGQVVPPLPVAPIVLILSTIRY